MFSTSQPSAIFFLDVYIVCFSHFLWGILHFCTNTIVMWGFPPNLGLSSFFHARCRGRLRCCRLRSCERRCPVGELQDHPRKGLHRPVFQRVTMLIYNISYYILYVLYMMHDYMIYYIYISHMYIQVVTKKKQRSKTPDQSPSLDPPRTGFVKKPRRWIVNG